MSRGNRVEPIGHSEKTLANATPKPPGPANFSVLKKTAIGFFLLLGILILLAIFAARRVRFYPEPYTRAMRATSEINLLITAIDAFKTDCGRYPSAVEGVAALLHRPSYLRAWHGLYLRYVPTDPWLRSYIYRFPSKRDPTGFDILSVGPDGIADTADDISN